MSTYDSIVFVFVFLILRQIVKYAEKVLLVITIFLNLKKSEKFYIRKFTFELTSPLL